MSKIANRILSVPRGVSVDFRNGEISIEGPNGKLTQKVSSEVSLVIENETILTKSPEGTDQSETAIVGTINSLISNMLKGVSEKYEKILDIKGVGYKVSLKDRVLDFSLGYSHNIVLAVPNTLEVECLNSIKLIIRGADKQEVGWFAAKIRDFRRPSPFVKSYKGIFYNGEKVKIKSGKKDAKK